MLYWSVLQPIGHCPIDDERLVATGRYIVTVRIITAVTVENSKVLPPGACGHMMRAGAAGALLRPNIAAGPPTLIWGGRAR